MRVLAHPVFLYAVTALIWGSTFYAIKFQLGVVAVELSVAYRFAFAALILFLWCKLSRRSLQISLAAHGWLALQGILLFGLNYLLVYWASFYLTSGLIAVVFSTVMIMNLMNGAIFLKRRPEPAVMLAAAVGLVGIALVFWPEVVQADQKSDTWLGLGLSFLGTFCASLGNILSGRNQAAGLAVVQSNAFGMAYGAALLFVIAWAMGRPLVFDASQGYVLSLLYLAVFGSVLAFTAYLTLLGQIGPERAAYVMVLFPLIALLVSTVFEGYQWSAHALLGVVLVVIGNVVMLSSRRPS